MPASRTALRLYCERSPSSCLATLFDFTPTLSACRYPSTRWTTLYRYGFFESLLLNLIGYRSLDARFVSSYDCFAPGSTFRPKVCVRHTIVCFIRQPSPHLRGQFAMNLALPVSSRGGQRPGPRLVTTGTGIEWVRSGTDILCTIVHRAWYSRENMQFTLQAHAVLVHSLEPYQFRYVRVSKWLCCTSTGREPARVKAYLVFGGPPIQQS